MPGSKPTRRRPLGPAAPLGLLLLLLPALPASGQHVRLVGDGENWRYMRGLSEPPGPPPGPGSPAAWTMPAYDDTAWETGVPSFGYGDRDDVTVLADMQGRFVSVYARRVFFMGGSSGAEGGAGVPDGAAGPGTAVAAGGGCAPGGRLPALDRLWLTVDYDDGFVAYLNGREIARRGLGAPGGFVPHDALASSHEAGVLETIDVTGFLGLLRPGRNVLALQGHNASPGSSDFTLTATLHATGPVGVARYPYLQSPGPDRVTIAWRTDRPGAGGVWILPAEPAGLRVVESFTEDVPARLHAVEVTGLSPDTPYHYIVTLDGRPLTGGDLFRTLPAPGGGRIAFNAVGDSGVDTGVSRAVRGRWLATRAPLGLRLGDMAYERGSEEEFENNYFAVYRDFLRRGFDLPSIGNHEAGTNQAQPYLDNLFLPLSEPGGTERYYALTAGPALFISLDVHTSPFHPGSAQHQWLERTLAAATQTWKFAFMHHGPYSCSLRHGSNLAVRQSFSPLFERYGVDVVFAGHDHGYERSRPVRDFVPDGSHVRYVVSGGGGRSLYPWSLSCPWTAAASSEEEIVTVSVDGACLSLAALRPDGSVLDAEAWCKPNAAPVATPSGAGGPAPPRAVSPRPSPGTPGVVEEKPPAGTEE